MGATELIQGLGRGLAVLRERAADERLIAAVERDVTALDAIAARDHAAGEEAAADLIAHLYAGHVAPAPVAAPAAMPPPAGAPGGAAPAPGWAAPPSG